MIYENVPKNLVTDVRSTRPGVGICYQQEIHAFLNEHLDAIDYLEIVPDTAWTDRGAATSPRYVDDERTLRFFQTLRQRMPIVAHSIGLSIGSAHRFRQEHLQQINRWDRILDFPWHSDHLAFNIVMDSQEKEYLLGVPFPVTLDVPTLELLLERIQHIMAILPKPFLLENNVSYIQYVEQDLDEPAFLNELCSRGNCGLLLDLHNLYVNWRNQVVDIDDFLAALDLSHVVEIHLAGGLTYNGVYLDAHSGRVPDDVWRIARDVFSLCPKLRGVTFELLGSWFGKMGEEALLETLQRMRELVRSSYCEAIDPV